MAVIDQHRTWHKVEERLATETDPVLGATSSSSSST